MKKVPDITFDRFIWAAICLVIGALYRQTLHHHIYVCRSVHLSNDRRLSMSVYPLFLYICLLCRTISVKVEVS